VVLKSSYHCFFSFCGTTQPVSKGQERERENENETTKRKSMGFSISVAKKIRRNFVDAIDSPA
jgi:hypothetical protein